MRSPSEKLTELVSKLRLCSPQDLLACEKRVRRLCHDLPDFDSVWLDALVQQRLITPWQADALQSGSPDRIRIGNYLLHQPSGTHSFLGFHMDGGQAFVLRRTDLVRPTDGSADAGRRLQELIDVLARSGQKSPACLLLPREVVFPTELGLSGEQSTDVSGTPSTLSLASAESWVVSPHVPGWSLDELLIRGGRLPWPVVSEIGRDLLTGLAWLESVRLLHGNVVLRNARLTPQGRTVLLAPFLKRIQHPHVMLTESLTLSDCEGVAPEQVGTGRMPDTRSELYSLGCLLWQLLTCRPVVLSADPVSRLMKQKEQDIADVRTVVPDCPEWMARIIQSMTRRSPELRPASVEEVLKLWKSNSGGGHSQARAIAHEMPDRTPRQKRPVAQRAVRGKGSPGRKAVLSAVVMSLLVIIGATSGVMPMTLRLGPPSSWIAKLQSPSISDSDVNSTAATSPDAVPANETNVLPPETPGTLLSLPAPDTSGRILLRAGHTYRATSIQLDSDLNVSVVSDRNTGRPQDRTSTASEPVRTMAVVQTAPGTSWKLSAPKIELNNITVQQEPDDPLRTQVRRPMSSAPESAESEAGRSATTAMVQINSTELHIDHCIFQASSEGSAVACMEWHSPKSKPERLEFRNSIFSGRGYAIRLSHPPERLQLNNLVLGTLAAALRCDFSERNNRQLRMIVTNVSQRNGTSFIDVVVPDRRSTNVAIAIQSGESVLAPKQSLIRVAAPEGWPVSQFRCNFLLAPAGNATIVPPGIEWGLFFDPQLKTFVRLPEKQLGTESLLIAEPVFADAVSDEDIRSGADGSGNDSGVNQFLLSDYEGPKLNTVMPGVVVEKLPVGWKPD